MHWFGQQKIYLNDFIQLTALRSSHGAETFESK